MRDFLSETFIETHCIYQGWHLTNIPWLPEGLPSWITWLSCLKPRGSASQKTGITANIRSSEELPSVKTWSSFLKKWRSWMAGWSLISNLRRTHEECVVFYLWWVQVHCWWVHVHSVGAACWARLWHWEGAAVAGHSRDDADADSGPTAAWSTPVLKRYSTP
jgi:hypothetical protein